MDLPWMIDELAYVGPEHLDPAFVAGFDRKQGPGEAEQDAAALAAHGLGEDATVVDLGTGTGRFALAAARRFGRVVACDIAPAMLDHLRGRVEAEHAEGVEPVRAGFLTYRHAGAPADAVHTRHALHQLPDFFKGVALDRIAGLLRPGGLLLVRDLVYDFTPAEAPKEFAAWFAGASDDAAAGYTAEDYVQHIRTEFSTYRPLFESLLDLAGFDILETEYHARCFGRYLCAKR